MDSAIRAISGTWGKVWLDSDIIGECYGLQAKAAFNKEEIQKLEKTAIDEIKSQGPELLIVAVPVSPSETAEVIRNMVDRFVCLDIPMSYLGAVGMYYMEFSQVTDEEVIALLKAANKK